MINGRQHFRQLTEVKFKKMFLIGLAITILEHFVEYNYVIFRVFPHYLSLFWVPYRFKEFSSVKKDAEVCK